MPKVVTSRVEQRRETKKRILDVARRLFVEVGFDRTTFRLIATHASVDPRLISHYFGSKEHLFLAAVRHDADQDAAGDTLSTADKLLTGLGVKISGMPETSLAMLRSMLTHPEAAELARTEIDEQIRSLATTIHADDATLRAALLLAVNIGVTVARELLEVSELQAASPAAIATILKPAFRALSSGDNPKR